MGVAGGVTLEQQLAADTDRCVLYLPGRYPLDSIGRLWDTLCALGTPPAVQLFDIGDTTMNDVTTGAASTRTRAEKTKRLFLTASGEATPRAGLESVAGKIIFVGAEDSPLTFKYDDLSPEVARAAALFGIMTSVTNTVGRADMSLADMYEAAEARLAAIVDEGRWSAERESGPRTNDLIEAARRWYAERNKPFTDEMAAAMQAKLADEKSGPDYRTQLQRNVAVHFAAIKAERAAERAAKAKERTPDSEVDDLI